jgi:hypothetical protein
MNAAGITPTVFSVLEKPVSDARKLGSTSEEKWYGFNPKKQG